MEKSSSPTAVRIPAHQLQNEFYRILMKNSFPEGKAKACADIFVNNSIDGVYTHGVNRFPKFVELVKSGYVNSSADPVRKHAVGAIEQWDGLSGVGVLNAMTATARAMELAKQFGLGCVALANTNHWMRAGAYGRKAAKEGFAFIGWTNTIRNTPAWGAVDPRLGNNPLVMAVPYQDDAVVLDMAMSQYSYGALELYRLKNETLPYPGGFDEKGNLTHDPVAIIQSRRTLPIGYWKGAGLSLLLDILATILSGGLSVASISRQPVETNVSQIFIAFDLTQASHYARIPELIHQIIEDYHQSTSDIKGKPVRYPGEQILKTREDNLRNGVPVLESVWNEIISL